MGPRPFSRGNQMRRVNTGILPLLWCFNGATTFQPWKRSNPLLTPNRDKQLQWGHDLSAVETTTHCSPRTVTSSFNGATTFQPWKPG